MECPHLLNNVRLKSGETDEDFTITKELECSECMVKEQIWICLHCGIVSCGRYISGHAKSHAEKNDHQLCMSCEIFSVYCYKCDEYAINDTPDKCIDKTRQSLMKYRHEYQNDFSKDETEDSSVHSSNGNCNRVEARTPVLCEDSLPERRITSLSPLQKDSSRHSAHSVIPVRNFSIISDTLSENSDPYEQQSWKSSSKTPEDTVRNLRPRSRKRSHSEDSSSTENSVGAGQLVPQKKQSPSNGKTQREKKVVGLRNLGNTCFMNAVLQSLSNIQEFSYYFSNLPSLEGKANGKKIYHSRSYTKEVHDVVMAEELRKVLINLNAGGCGSKGAISPECLFLVIWKVVPRFRGYQQQDAHEFLRYMLDRLHTELLQLLPPDMSLKDSAYFSMMQRGSKNSIVTTVFGGTLQSEVRCLSCGTESKKHDPFLDLSLDIPDKFVPKRSGGTAVANSNAGMDDSLPPICSIADCLTSFIEVEELADTELYFCSSCKSKQKSTKRFWIRRLPNVLCLHIKRFRWTNFFRTKIDTNISFPLMALDMSQFVLSNLPETRRSSTGNNLYDLAAVIVHHGSGAGSGHYTAFAINDEQWFHFNDSTVRPTDQETVAACKAYILFYIRREFSLPQGSSTFTNEISEDS